MRSLAFSDVPDLVTIAQAVLPQQWKKEDFEFFIAHSASYSRAARDAEGVLVSFFLGLRVRSDLDTLVIATRADSQRQGWGKKILKEIQSDPSIEKIFLEVDMRNAAAIGLYSGSGFESSGVRKKYYEGKHDAFSMRWIRSNSLV